MILRGVLCYNNGKLRRRLYAGHLFFREGDHETGLGFIQSEVARHIAETGQKPVVFITISRSSPRWTSTSRTSRIWTALSAR